MITVNNNGSQLEVSKPSVNNGTTMVDVGKVTVNDGTAQRLVWTAWNGEIYDNGNIFEELTGGWIKKNGSQISSSVIAFNSNHIFIQARRNNGQNAQTIFSTVKSIDMTPYTKIKATIDADIPAWTKGSLLRVNGKSAYGWDKAYDGAVGERKNNWTITLDISNIRGSYPVEFVLETTPSEPWVRIYKIWME